MNATALDEKYEVKWHFFFFIESFFFKICFCFLNDGFPKWGLRVDIKQIKRKHLVFL